MSQLHYSRTCADPLCRNIVQSEEAFKDVWCPMHKALKPIPAFKNEQEEREFWQTHSSTDYIDWSKAEVRKLL